MYQGSQRRFGARRERIRLDLGGQVRLAAENHLGSDRWARPQRDRKAREVRPVVLFECRQDVRVRGVDEAIRFDQRDETAVADEVGRGSRDLD